jgi:hypothetical protein
MQTEQNFHSQNYLCEHIFAFFPSTLRFGQKEHANSIFPCWWKLKPKILSNLRNGMPKTMNSRFYIANKNGSRSESVLKINK